MCRYKDLEECDIVIKTHVMNKVCKYQKKKGQEYDLSEIAPAGMCLESFNGMYPKCLAMFYGNNYRKDTYLCPSKKVKFEIRRKHKHGPFYVIFISFPRLIFRLIFGMFFFPIDWNHKDFAVYIKVKSVHGDCPLDQEEGDKFYMNTDDTNRLCPASFYSIYPHLIKLHDGKKTRWQEKPNEVCVRCPDHEGMVYKLKKPEIKRKKALRRKW